MIPQTSYTLTLHGAVEACASALVTALPDDGSAVEATLDAALDVLLYRCARTSGAVARLAVTGAVTANSGAAPHSLTGGVQLRVTLPATREEAARVVEARLRPGWTDAQLYRRLVTVLSQARADYEARLAREAVADRLRATGVAGEYVLAELGLDTIESLTPKDAALALAALARLV